MITTIPDYLVLRLWDVFPESFSVVIEQQIPVDPYREATPWGMEDHTEYETETTTLASEILGTAKAFTHDGNYPGDGLRYIDSFKAKKDQTQAIKAFRGF